MSNEPARSSGRVDEASGSSASPGLVALERGDYASAASLLAAAIEAGEKTAANYRGLGLAFIKSEQPVKAIQALEQALSLNAEDLGAQHNLGLALMKAGRYAEALPRLRRSVEAMPTYWEAHWAVGTTLVALGLVREGIVGLRRAVELAPERHDIHAVLLFSLELSPDATLEEQQAERRRWYERHAASPATPSRPLLNRKSPERRVRVGYVSADFRAHSAAMIFGPVIRYHDRNAFEIFCYSGIESNDVLAESLRAAADRWRPTAKMSDEDLEALIRDDEVDILVDLSGHTKGHRLAIFARRAAPIQVTAWGFATGTGIPAMDYFFSDPVAVPREVRHLFAETVVDLPCCFCYEPPGDAPEVSPLPSLEGQPFTFGCINRIQKISDPAIALWARILREMPGSRLLLKSHSLSNEAVRAETLRRFAGAGMSEDRLLLLSHTDIYHHMQALHQVDLGLDPFPANGGITTAETLWMGVPVVTVLGKTTHGRLSGALLHALGMPDWIATNEDEYVRIALEFAEDREHLDRLRRGMREELMRTPVFNVREYTRLVEANYRLWWQKWCRQA
ncbi:MAG: tetratricopeptide repeat protein [Betaproteobacteria bacterium]|nr:tetratricopeptide repeat protein [Betaproteobacteria bacterium]